MQNPINHKKAFLLLQKIYKMNLLNPRKYFLVIIISFAFCISAAAQTNSFENIISSLTSYHQNHLREKVYVHTDRDYYLAGDILWFKSYVENATDNKPLSLSKIVYVEVLNRQREPVLQAKISLKDGSGSGSFQLPFTLASGNYELRAYTNWMKNDSPDFYFKKFFTIINTSAPLDTSILNKPSLYHLSFFPEGGNLVNGLNSVVGFKLDDQSGNGLAAEGVIVNQSQDTLAHFQSNRFGMGHFSFTPKSGDTYRGIVFLPNNSLSTNTLPEAFNSGYVMHLSDAGNQLKIKVNSANVSSEAVFLIAETRQKIGFSATSKITNNEAVFNIDKGAINEGVAHITLFDANGQPLCERLYFKRPKDKMVIQVKAGKQSFSKRDKVNIDLSTQDEEGKSLAGNLSVSVYRLDSLHQAGKGNIYNYLWLSSDVKGDIENPGYYFENNNAETDKDLDDLLLTQGWRTFDWKNIGSHSPSFAYVPENAGHIITGKITNEITGKPADNVLVYLSVPGRRVQLYGCLSDANGFVHFDLKDFYGPNQVVLQTNTTKDSIYHLEISSPFSESFSKTSSPGFAVSENDRSDLETSNLHMEIENGYHQNDLQKFQAPDIDSLPFYYKPSKTYLLDNYTRFITIEEVMREYVAEVNVIRRQKKYHFNTFNNPGFLLQNLQPSEKVFEKDPLVLLDGVPVFDVDNIIAYDPLKVQKLEVVDERYIWGPITADGIVSYTTYQGNLPGFTLNPHDIVLDYNGLQKQRIFYSPDYSNEKLQQSRLPDFRDVLYWSPDIKTDSSGNGNISFYTGDVPGKYLVVLQGISANGDAGSENLILNVGK